MEIKTSYEPKRVIYFRGINKDSLMITQVYRDYQTFSKLYTGECASRTLSNLYNLQTVRGKINKSNELILNISMSGPHHYFGYISPFETHIIEIKNLDSIAVPIYKSIQMTPAIKKYLVLPSHYNYIIDKYNWIRGINLNSKQKKI